MLRQFYYSYVVPRFDYVIPPFFSKNMPRLDHSRQLRSSTVSLLSKPENIRTAEHRPLFRRTSVRSRLTAELRSNRERGSKMGVFFAK